MSSPVTEKPAWQQWRHVLGVFLRTAFNIVVVMSIVSVVVIVAVVMVMQSMPDSSLTAWLSWWLSWAVLDAVRGNYAGAQLFGAFVVDVMIHHGLWQLCFALPYRKLIIEAFGAPVKKRISYLVAGASVLTLFSTVFNGTLSTLAFTLNLTALTWCPALIVMGSCCDAVFYGSTAGILANRSSIDRRPGRHIRGHRIRMPWSRRSQQTHELSKPKNPSG